ncbi:hypothetical protein B0T09DRAFT_360308 [Sordaria sp. MPI-SDFR-AT-0083]|nr:hypothetical protein B0T09DRAFT_360308 [Sordaria sp. MPI-SDFR-AT-0083]
MLHRGPRVLLQLIIGSTIIFATLLVIRRGFGEDLSSTDLFRWSENKSEDMKDENVHYEFQSQQHPSGLRVVVFGEDDVATPAWTRGEKEMRSPGWTEVMCRELKCSHYLSFIPPNIHPPAHSLVSNDIYVEAVRQTIKNTTKLKKTQGPGYDYTFQPRLFPVSKALPDLSAQITTFLELQNSTTFPKANETLWVFNFGQWDIWSLATLPVATGKAVIDQLTDHVIEQIERLYESTLQNNTTVILSSNPKLLPRKTKTKTGPMKIIDPEVYKAKSTAAAGVAVSNLAKAKTAKAKPDTFRVFFPALFDISMTPGWSSNRPETPAPHSKAEQMRNAAKLTETWNQVMGDKLYIWAERSDDIGLEDLYLNPDADTNEFGTLDGRSASVNSVGKRNPTGQRKKASQEAGKIVNQSRKTKPKQPKPPIRDFITYDMVSYLTSALIEGQLRSSGLSDGNGLGQKPMSKWYKQVWEPCVKPVRSEDEMVMDLEEEGVLQLSSSNSSETTEESQVGQGVKAGAAAGGGGGARDQKKAAGQGKAAGQDQGQGSGNAAGHNKPGGQGKAAWVGAGKRIKRNVEAEKGEETVTVCNFPDDYLFYTPFTLGGRAIREIAKEAVDKVRRGESFRQMEGTEEGLWAGVTGHI